ncbi:hypothetical protein TOPH_06948 [Tolypocladium ophioglossoides CBS 100239]|uniref:DNA endonuclease activator Ctp1 C-terminal domain-containing protein n=1 Tax=Tolypocladium ophioglossoides (strain CBS 100239) TaxID=1163406 RepID=A0A0L0N347_TOLOC|nr:hypothetical protein TOPH_06948 [Tolypocladium ophioglossoides CBS 100239]
MAAVLTWFETGRPALFAALKDICHQIDMGLAAEQDKINQMNKKLLGTLQESEAEIIMLYEQLEEVTAERDAATAALPPGTAASVAPPQPTPSAPASTPESNDAAAVKSKFSKLRRRFIALSANFKTAKDALQKRKDERDKWMQHALHLEQLIMAAEEEHGIQILNQKDQSARTPSRILNVVNEASPEQRAGHGGAEAELPPTTATTTTANEERTLSNMPSDSTQGEVEDGSEEQLPQIRIEEPNDHVSVKQEPSSDAPVVVSERAVKKRKCESGPDATEPRVKAEHRDDSSPIVSTGRYAFNTQESLDLGDIEQRMTTPRKRKELEQSESRGDRTAPELELFSTPAVAAAKRGQPHQSAVGAERPPSVLTPLSVNVRTARSEGAKPSSRPLKRGLGYALSVLAEDGDVYNTWTNISAAGTKGLTPTAAPTNGRLSTLLNSPLPATEEEVISSPAGKRATGKRRILPVASNIPLPIPERRELPFEKGAAQAGKSPQDGSAPRSDMSLLQQLVREKSPQRKKGSSASSLRSKPLDELRLDDFKINPQANEGHDFAFADVVRDKGDRACLPGCTDMHCCGKQFRALALSQRPNPPLTPAQRMEEQKLLEEYLGDYAYRLVSITKEAREELWVEAKTAELANKYGKHRHRFSRKQSPPGFWNADFPNTQELEADRAEAAKREKQAVAERYRDAMRPGRRWMFKDE